MTEEQKIQVVQQMISDMSVDEETILSYLALAADRILNRVYPFGGAPGEFPPQYDWVQVQLTVRMIARIGGEGEISHSENGISRTYGSVDDEDIFATLVPYVGVI
jgi:hypothetical protein